MTSTRLPTVDVAGVPVVDATEDDVVVALSEAATAPVLAFALHVGGLNAVTDPRVVDAYRSGDLTYADGAAIVLLARLSGARSVERAPTTDLGPRVLQAHADAGRRRVFLIGGPPGLAEAAGQRLAGDHGLDVVGAVSGYDVDTDALVARLHTTRPDVVIVGLGSPREMLFLSALREALPPAVYLTCGGWFGFVVGHEQRAPAALRGRGLEWVWRLRQHPRRLLGRYARGALTTARLAAVIAVRRASRVATSGRR
ncbi:N-acetylglucosaminyldiphosphoundecaprenol N-acetyl-beta-D-mannosaminyltransferase [Geodermatophilus telluris]|uniref:N-acetylglucosaminyldiphosphoundecaprenol N-acetyl-beta-D-mannosaminyltransferase n=1 Tax=Geodermatophilus telluris TaxID=1190417 RepID=A0A1G6L7D0_9ACTN|nr:WecB/TagA/CpsF family glycosyltransferase [Geodermatophilus telluris]SDC39091.1 N-acetylglucosaminyldiphosphoundecaprenol N-acetyl-beta-D-mannosaminyltransferase [Geodermatophilus telluris]